MLKGSRVFLRPLEPYDLDKTLEWINDPEIFITMGVFGPRSSQSQKDWYNGLVNNRNNLVFAVCNLNNIHIGNVSLFDVDYRNRNAALTIFLYGDENQGKGYGPDVLRLLIEYGFNYLNLERIYCKTDNKHAAKVYERLGFKHEGTLRKQAYRKGAYVDKYVYGLLRDEYIGNQLK